MNEHELAVRVRLPLASFELALDVRSRARALGIFGASGSGKTSTLECIAGWRRGLIGHISLGERVLVDSESGVDVPIEARRIGYVPQDALLFPHWSVRDNILASRRGRGDGDEHVFARCIDVLQIGSLLDRRPATLSGGEARRVAIARALCSSPKLLLLDEPLAALDVALRGRILADLVSVRDAFDVPMVYVSHDATEVQALCEECIVLREGRVVAQGDPKELLRSIIGLEDTFENVLEGVMVGTEPGSATVRLQNGVEIAVAGALDANGTRVVFSLSSADILISTRRPEGLSARNIVRARIQSIDERAESAHVVTALGGEPAVHVSVALTPAAVRQLALARGVECWVVFKASSCRVLAARRIGEFSEGSS